MGGRRGFTIIELLVTVAILAILVAILVPSMIVARETAKAAGCLANIRCLGTGFIAFGVDHFGRIPGCGSQFADTGAGDVLDCSQGKMDAQNLERVPNSENNIWMADWCAGMDRNYNNHTDADLANRTGLYAQPTRGTIFPYVKTTKVYRCPSLAFVSYNSGMGSNGQFDYTMSPVLSGATADIVPRMATVSIGGTVAPIQMMTPMLLEEDPAHSLNASTFSDSRWCNDDQTTNNHKKGTNIMAVDGSGFWFRPPLNFTLVAHNVKMTTNRGTVVSGAGDGYSFGYLNGQ